MSVEVEEDGCQTPFHSAPSCDSRKRNPFRESHTHVLKVLVNSVIKSVQYNGLVQLCVIGNVY